MLFRREQFNDECDCELSRSEQLKQYEYDLVGEQ